MRMNIEDLEQPRYWNRLDLIHVLSEQINVTHIKLIITYKMDESLASHNNKNLRQENICKIIKLQGYSNAGPPGTLQKKDT
jgi:hypothetical protein